MNRTNPQSTCLSVTDLKLGADGGPSVLDAALQSVLFVPAQYMFEQVVDKVQPDETKTDTRHATE